MGVKGAAKYCSARMKHLIVLLLIWTPIAGLRADSQEELKVLSYNIHQWRIGVDELAKLIREADADIIGLNEAWNEKRNEEIAEKLGFNVVYGGQNPPDPKPKPKPHTVNDFYMPQVLLTRHKVVHSQVFNAMAAKDHEAFDPEVPIYRGGTLAVLETTRGNRVAVFVLHLHPWGDGDNEKMTTMRLEEMKGILKKLEPHKDLPTLIIGDFNTRSHEDGYKGWKVSKQLAESGFSDLYRGIHSDSKADPGLTCGDGRIDYIFHNRLVKPVECRVVKDGVFGSRGYEQSDHLAVFGVVKIKKAE